MKKELLKGEVYDYEAFINRNNEDLTNILNLTKSIQTNMYSVALIIGKVSEDSGKAEFTQWLTVNGLDKVYTKSTISKMKKVLEVQRTAIKAGYDVNLLPKSVENNYALNCLKDVDLDNFLKYCGEQGIDLGSLKQKELRDRVKKYKESAKMDLINGDLEKVMETCKEKFGKIKTFFGLSYDFPSFTIADKITDQVNGAIYIMFLEEQCEIINNIIQACKTVPNALEMVEKVLGASISKAECFSPKMINSTRMEKFKSALKEFMSHYGIDENETQQESAQESEQESEPEAQQEEYIVFKVTVDQREMALSIIDKIKPNKNVTKEEIELLKSFFE